MTKWLSYFSLQLHCMAFNASGGTPTMDIDIEQDVSHMSTINNWDRHKESQREQDIFKGRM